MTGKYLVFCLSEHILTWHLHTAGCDISPWYWFRASYSVNILLNRKYSFKSIAINSSFPQECHFQPSWFFYKTELLETGRETVSRIFCLTLVLRRNVFRVGLNSAHCQCSRNPGSHMVCVDVRGSEGRWTASELVFWLSCVWLAVRRLGSLQLQPALTAHRRNNTLSLSHSLCHTKYHTIILRSNNNQTQTNITGTSQALLVTD